ncbi:MAG: hypothetical protein NZM25_04675 [Leptospiraceae bacterium]|nr:hypothetical protein [Leptospiraceae bacterium]MDW8305692.1 hypothetical protein [Leptospiraceae bacterium]
MKKVLLLVLCLLALMCQSDTSPWIWKIEGKPTTLKQFEAAYEGYLTLMREQFQMMTGRSVPHEEFIDYIANPEKLGNPQLQQLFRGLQKKNFADQYKIMLILNQEAARSGFLKREDIRARIDYMQKYFVANMFLMEKVKPADIQIDENEAVQRWEKVRAQDPRYRTIPYEQGLELAKQDLQGQKLKLKQEEIISQIREQYKVEPNENFSLAEYLKGEKKEEPGQEKKPTEEKK